MGSGSESQIVGAAKENDLQPYFINFADGTEDVSFLMVCRVATLLLYRIKVLTHARLAFDTTVHGKPV